MIGRTFQRAGKWWVDYTDDRTGKRIRKCVAHSKSEAEDALARIRTNTEWKGHFEPKKAHRMLFKDLADEYLVWSKNNKKSWDSDAQILKRLVGVFGNRTLSEITPEMMEQYKTKRKMDIGYRTGKIVSPRTVNYDLAIMKAVFNKAIRWGKAKNNPMMQVSLLRLNNNRKRYLDQKEINALLAACTGQWRAHLKPIVVIALNTGMRRGEILGLRWSDIDYSKGLIHLRTSKNGEGRDLPMNDDVREALRSCMSVQQVVDGQQDSPVFCDGQGKPRKEIRNAFFSALKAAGIKDCHFHDLRHTFASHLVSNGVEIAVIKELLGHKSIEMTLRYAHLAPERGARAVARLSGIYGTDVASTPARKE